MLKCFLTILAVLSLVCAAAVLTFGHSLLPANGEYMVPKPDRRQLPVAVASSLNSETKNRSLNREDNDCLDGRWATQELVDKAAFIPTSKLKFTPPGFTVDVSFNNGKAGEAVNGVSACVGAVTIQRTDAAKCFEDTQRVFSKDAAFASWVSRAFGADLFRVLLRGPEVVMANITLQYPAGYETARAAQRSDASQCPIYTGVFFVTRPGQYQLYAELVYESHRAINEMTEKTWYDLSQTDLFTHPDKRPLLTCKCNEAPSLDVDCSAHVQQTQTQSQFWGRWVSVGRDLSDFKREFPNYWLNMGKPWERKLNIHTPDALGRMDFGDRYEWRPYTCKHRVFSKNNILELLRDTPLYFFGDSHMRMTFYGLLAKLGIKYSPDKIWRGDRVDVIREFNTSVSYVASYFLNTSRETAVQMLQNNDGIILAGVGQHHSSGCWNISKHAQTVEDAMQDFDNHNAKVIWFGVPAFPMNKHMRLAQKRTDCRNNLRHRLLNKIQYELARFRQYPIVDTYSKSWPMIHTSPDGAHYYNWVRDAWIDDIFASFEQLKRKGTSW
ncbi:putative GDSL/SGNH-like acylesterase [Diplonema papillatum]|nr:putative GDSL/SGNH-like acylesterase [Diplonema papillatum]